MSSDLDCIECGGYIDLERYIPNGLCQSCNDALAADLAEERAHDAHQQRQRGEEG